MMPKNAEHTPQASDTIKYRTPMCGAADCSKNTVSLEKADIVVYPPQNPVPKHNWTSGFFARAAKNLSKGRGEGFQTHFQ